MRRYRAFLIPAIGLLAVVIGFLVFNLQENLVYYREPAEVQADAEAGPERFRLGGQVVPGSIVESDEGVAFAVTDGHATIDVSHRGAPQQLFADLAVNDPASLAKALEAIEVTS